MRITHIITGLDVGGAEIMLYRLLTKSKDIGVVPQVVSLSSDGPIGVDIRSLGIPVFNLGIRNGCSLPAAIPSLCQILNRTQPDLVHTWMYHSNLLGGMAAKLTVKRRVLWSVHHGALNFDGYRKSTWIVAKWGALAARRLCDRIVLCSGNSRDAHVQFGFPEDLISVIPNGFDVASLVPDVSASKRLKSQLGVDEDTLLIGHFGRFHPLKDHRTLAMAAAIFVRTNPKVAFVFCGTGVTPDNPSLVEMLSGNGIFAMCHLMGHQNEVSRVMQGLDIGTLSSIAEGFPLALGEMMACGVPCVATDVGDCSYIMGETGVVVPPRNPDALARGWRALAALDPSERRHRGELARQRIVDRFALDDVAKDYRRLYTTLSAGNSR